MGTERHDIYLYEGEPNPSDIRLTDPTVREGVQHAEHVGSSGVAVSGVAVITRHLVHEPDLEPVGAGGGWRWPHSIYESITRVVPTWSPWSWRRKTQPAAPVKYVRHSMYVRASGGAVVCGAARLDYFNDTLTDDELLFLLEFV